MNEEHQNSNFQPTINIVDLLKQSVSLIRYNANSFLQLLGAWLVLELVLLKPATMLLITCMRKAHCGLFAWIPFLCINLILSSLFTYLIVSYLQSLKNNSKASLSSTLLSRFTKPAVLSSVILINFIRSTSCYVLAGLLLAAISAFGYALFPSIAVMVHSASTKLGNILFSSPFDEISPTIFSLFLVSLIFLYFYSKRMLAEYVNQLSSGIKIKGAFQTSKSYAKRIKKGLLFYVFAFSGTILVINCLIAFPLFLAQDTGLFYLTSIIMLTLVHATFITCNTFIVWSLQGKEDKQN